MTKIINGVTYRKTDGVYLPIDECSSSRIKSWITLGQINKEFKEFHDKLNEIIYNSNYNIKAKEYAVSIKEYIDLWKWVSWKQFDSIFKICETYKDFMKGKERGYYSYNSIISYHCNGLSFTTKAKNACKITTDIEFDKLHKQIFGFKPMLHDDDGEPMFYDYDKDGKRFAYLPTDKELENEFLDACVPQNIINNFFIN